MSYKYKKDELIAIIFILTLLICTLLSNRDEFTKYEISNLLQYTINGIVLLTFISLLTSRFKITSKVSLNFARDWWPITGGLFTYAALKHLYANNITVSLGIRTKDDIILKIERIMFGKALPLYTESIINPHLTKLMDFSYNILYYGFPLFVLIYFQINSERRQHFYTLRRSILTTLFGGYVLYLIFPVAGPLFTIGDSFSKTLFGDSDGIKLSFDNIRYNWDCFPSLHTAIPWVVTLISFRHVNNWLRLIFILISIAITFSTIYLRHHYGIDLIAGFVLSYFVYLSFKNDNICLDNSISNKDLNLNQRQKIRTLLILFTLTGFTGLISEQIYEKILETVVGSGAISASIVLSAFFLGLSFGAYAYTKMQSLREDPLFTFVSLEIFIGVWSLFIYLFFHQIQSISSSIIHNTPQVHLLLSLSKFIVAGAWILPPTLAMGASFPAVVGIVKQWRLFRPQILITKLYSFNVLGAVIATLLGPYWLFSKFGLVESLSIITLIEAFVAFLAILILRQTKLHTLKMVDKTHNKPHSKTFNKQVKTVLAISFFSGFLFFSFEVIWVHLIGSILGNSIYSFSTMLTVVLTSIFTGGIIIANHNKNQTTIPVSFFVLILLSTSFFLTFSFYAWDKVPAIFPFIRPMIDETSPVISSFTSGQITRFLFCFILVGGPCLYMSMLYPLLFRIIVLPEDAHDNIIAKISCFNSIGSILGALITGFYLIPIIGSELTYTAFNIVFALLGLMCIFVFNKPNNIPTQFQYLQRPLFILLFFLSVGLQLTGRWDRLWLTSGTNVYFNFANVVPGTKLLFWHEDTKGGFTTVVENDAGPQQKTTRTLLTNGKFQGNDGSEVPAQIGFAMIPLLHQHQKNRALVIGLGTGQTAAVIHAAGFDNVDIAEISPGIVVAAKKYFNHANDAVFSKNNVKLIYEDGRNLLLQNKFLYDLVSIEITNVWFAGSTNLYSREFYELAHRNLDKDGIFQQWIQFHHIDPDEVISAISTVRSVFPYVSVWYFGGQGILLASPSPLKFSPTSVDPKIISPEMLSKFLSFTGSTVFNPEDINKYMILSPEDVGILYSWHAKQNLPINTDGNRYLEFSTPKHNLDLIDMRPKVIEKLLLVSQKEL